MSWADAVEETIRKGMPQFLENARKALELEERFREAGIQVPQRAPILTAAYKALGLLDGDHDEA